mmetsp:Transcript_108951/g.339530  ORF Transcript_108951/g.339530 Transcript_108951/m.339530 type:complete len:221 (+) Transcript_108951:460-1122(+)
MVLGVRGAPGDRGGARAGAAQGALRGVPGPWPSVAAVGGRGAERRGGRGRRGLPVAVVHARDVDGKLRAHGAGVAVGAALAAETARARHQAVPAGRSAAELLGTGRVGAPSAPSGPCASHALQLLIWSRSLRISRSNSWDCRPVSAASEAPPQGRSCSALLPQSTCTAERYVCCPDGKLASQISSEAAVESRVRLVDRCRPPTSEPYVSKPRCSSRRVPL